MEPVWSPRCPDCGWHLKFRVVEAPAGHGYIKGKPMWEAVCPNKRTDSPGIGTPCAREVVPPDDMLTT